MLEWIEVPSKPSDKCKECDHTSSCKETFQKVKSAFTAMAHGYSYGIVEYYNGKIDYGYWKTRDSDKSEHLKMVMHSVDEAKEHLQIIADGFEHEAVDNPSEKLTTSSILDQFLEELLGDNAKATEFLDSLYDIKNRKYQGMSLGDLLLKDKLDFDKASLKDEE